MANTALKKQRSKFNLSYSIGIISPYSKISERYIAKEYLIFQLSAFVFLYLILLVNQLLVQAKNLLSKNVTIDALFRMLIYVTPSILLWAIPFSAIIGTFMAIGRMAADREILILRAYGWNKFRIFKPFLLYSIFLAFFSFFISNYITPYTNRKVKATFREIAQSVAIDAFRPYTTSVIGDRVVSVGKREGNVIYDVKILDKDNRFYNRSITSPKATILKTSSGTIVLKMDNVSIISAIADYQILNYQRASSDILNYYLNSKEFYIDQFTNDSLNVVALALRLISRTKEIIRAFPNYKEIRQTKNILERYELIKSRLRSHAIRSTAISLYEKISLAILPILLTYLALETAFKVRQTDSNIGLAIGVLLCVFYWFLVYVVRFYIINYSSSILALFIPEILLSIIILGIRYSDLFKIKKHYSKTKQE